MAMTKLGAPVCNRHSSLGALATSRHSHASHKRGLCALALRLLLLTLLLVATACGTANGSRRLQTAATGTADLQHFLTAELARLGKSASETTPHPPTGPTNAVFDLAATVIDPDGPPDGGTGGVTPPTGIALSWTERLLGDYDQNGWVNAADLTPLGAKWEATCNYDASALHQGIPYWPTGDPDDDGLDSGEAGGAGVPPALGSGAANWRIARTDGNGDSMLNAQDVTPIAVHWYEQSTGYRVYAKLPGETEFHVLPDPDNAAAPLTIPRSKLYLPEHNQVDPQRPVRFGLEYGDGTMALPDGRYEYYVAAYDATTDSDGPASPHVVMDIAAGVANQPPVAKLSVDPAFAGAPAVITFDASASTDPDGSIVEYRWDFDADGVVDWSTSDATVPEQSSGGEVDSITPGAAPGLGLPPTAVTVTYERTEGYANYIYPRVTVVDNKSATATQSVKLGVTGWEIVETLNSTRDEYDPQGDELKIIFQDMAFEPTSNKLAAVGEFWESPDAALHYNQALLYARRTGPNDWEYEQIRAAGQPLPDMNGNLALTKARMYWDTTGEPLIVLGYYQWSDPIPVLLDFRTYIARRSPAGVWSVNVLFAGTQPDSAKGSRGGGADDIYQNAPGELHILGYNKIASWSEEHSYNYQYVHYKDGAISVEPFGWPEPEHPTDRTETIFLDHDGQPCVVLFPLNYIDPTGIWLRRRTTIGDWTTARMDHGEYALQCDSIIVYEGVSATSGEIILQLQQYSRLSDTVVNYLDGVVQLNYELQLFKPVRVKTYNSGHPYLVSTSWGTSFTGSDRPLGASGYAMVYHDLVQSDSTIISEVPLIVPPNADDSCSLGRVMNDKSNGLFVIINVRGGNYPGATVNLLAHRVDPRGTP